MGLGNDLKKLFSRKKSLGKISVDELRRERVGMEQTESRLIKDIEEIEKKKQALFVKGKDEVSQRQQLIYARKIKELDVRSRNKDKQLALISKQLRILSGFEQIKENQKMLIESSKSSLLAKMDLSELQQYVEKAIVEGNFQMEKFTAILNDLEGGVLGGEFAEEDADILGIVNAMQEAKAAETSDESEVPIEEGIKKVDQILHKEKEEEEKM